MNPSTQEPFALSTPMERALREAFGNQTIANISPIRGGRSAATLYSLTVAGKDYILRAGDTSRPGYLERSHHEIACMKLAASQGIAPSLRYTNPEDAISIMAKIDPIPVARDSQRCKRMATLVRKLHHGPKFPNTFTPIAFVRLINTELQNHCCEEMPKQLVALLETLSELTRCYAGTAPCHGDLNPGNILETQEQMYFIDWELAGISDPYFDLGELGVFGFPNPEEHVELLATYLERAPSNLEHARLVVARVMALGFYATAFSLAAVMTCGTPPSKVTPLPIPELLQLLASAREQASPAVVASSLLAKMWQITESSDFVSASHTLSNQAPPSQVA
jgi:hypothetical protein